MDDGIKIEEVEQKDAYYARAEKDPNIFEADAHMPGREDQRHSDKHRRREDQTDEANLHGGQTRSGKATNEQADHTPQDACEEYR